MSQASVAGAAWLQNRGLQRLLTLLDSDGEEARIAGGAVRNALMGEPVADIDIATTALPEITIKRAQTAGMRAVPTGIEHGTVTVLSGEGAHEVTTLRADVETDGRHARVAFGRDWQADAERRDFTINALYATAAGEVIDLVGGLADLDARRLRFIGDPEARIREDYLRILRFFRFFAWYGSGRPDADGLKACVKLKSGLSTLSAERIWSELRKLLCAPDPSRALLWMRQASVLTAILPESERWGIDAIHGLVAAERDLGWQPDALLRLTAIVPPDAERMVGLGNRLRMSRAEQQRLTAWASFGPIGADTSERALRRRLYGSPAGAASDRLRLALAGARVRAMSDNAALIEAGRYSKLLDHATNWQEPGFPLTGADMAGLGMKPGPQMGAALTELRRHWIESDFTLDRTSLLDLARQSIAEQKNG